MLSAGGNTVHGKPLAICCCCSCWSVGPSLSTDDRARLAISKEIDDVIVSLFFSSSFQAQQVTAARFQIQIWLCIIGWRNFRWPTTIPMKKCHPLLKRRTISRKHDFIDARKMNARFSLRKTCWGRICIKRKTRSQYGHYPTTSNQTQAPYRNLPELPHIRKHNIQI